MKQAHFSENIKTDANKINSYLITIDICKSNKEQYSSFTALRDIYLTIVDSSVLGLEASIINFHKIVESIYEENKENSLEFLIEILLKFHNKTLLNVLNRSILELVRTNKGFRSKISEITNNLFLGKIHVRKISVIILPISKRVSTKMLEEVRKYNVKSEVLQKNKTLLMKWSNLILEHGPNRMCQEKMMGTHKLVGHLKGLYSSCLFAEGRVIFRVDTRIANNHKKITIVILKITNIHNYSLSE